MQMRAFTSLASDTSVKDVLLRVGGAAFVGLLGAVGGFAITNYMDLSKDMRSLQKEFNALDKNIALQLQRLDNRQQSMEHQLAVIKDIVLDIKEDTRGAAGSQP